MSNHGIIDQAAVNMVRDIFLIHTELRIKIPEEYNKENTKTWITSFLFSGKIF